METTIERIETTGNLGFTLESVGAKVIRWRVGADFVMDWGHKVYCLRSQST